MTDTVTSETVVRGAPGDVLAVLLDFESYPDWARGVKSVRVIDRDDAGRARDVEFVVTPGPLPRVRYVLRYAYGDDHLSWSYVEGDMRDVRGSYRLEPAGDGSVRVLYDLAIDPGKIPLPGFVKARAAREITRIALDELKRRVEG